MDGAVRTGTPPRTTLLDPGAHVPRGTGMHGIGVCTPRAAAVAAMTAGFAGELHIPKVGMFAIGIASAMVATGWPPAVTGVPRGIAVSGIGGPRPIVQDSMAPFTTTGGIGALSPAPRDPGAERARTACVRTRVSHGPMRPIGPQSVPNRSGLGGASAMMPDTGARRMP